MAFQSAASVVVALLFQLIDENGFVRLEFGPMTWQARDGYGLEYEEPSWTNDLTTTGIFFGTDTFQDEAITNLFAASDAQNAATVSTIAFDNGTPTRSTSAGIDAVDGQGTPRGAEATVIVQPDSDVCQFGVNVFRAPDIATLVLAIAAAGSTFDLSVDIPTLTDPSGSAGSLIIAGTVSSNYTPNLTGINLGGAGASNLANYRYIGMHRDASGVRSGMLFLNGELTLGAGFTAPTSTTVSLPAGYQINDAMANTGTAYGHCSALDVGTTTFAGLVRYNSSTTLRFVHQRANGAGDVQHVAYTAAIPFAWVAGDQLCWTAAVPVIRV